MRTTRRVLSSALLLLLLAACAGGGSPTTPGPGQSRSEPGSTTPVGPAASSLPPPAGPSRSAGPDGQTSTEVEDLTLLPTETTVGAVLTLTGIPTPGVEARCWLLDGYLLVEVPTELLGSGKRITVTGRVEQGLMTTCQQGIPLRVTSAAVAQQ